MNKFIKIRIFTLSLKNIYFFIIIGILFLASCKSNRNKIIQKHNQNYNLKIIRENTQKTVHIKYFRKNQLISSYLKTKNNESIQTFFFNKKPILSITNRINEDTISMTSYNDVDIGFDNKNNTLQIMSKSEHYLEKYVLFNGIYIPIKGSELKFMMDKLNETNLYSNLFW